MTGPSGRTPNAGFDAAPAAPAGPRALPPQPALHTERLRLTRFLPSDAPAVFAYASDPEFARHVTWAPSRSVADSEAFIRAALADAAAHVWAVRDAAEARAADARAADACAAGAPALGAVEFSLEPGGRGATHYVLARACWGRGLATEAVRAVLGWAFDALPELTEVRTTAAAGNAASRRVLEKCGFRPVGTEAAHWPKAPAPVPLVVYALARGALVRV